MTKKFKSTEETIHFVEALKRRWMATVDAIVDPIMIIDREYNIQQTNKALAQHSNRDFRSLIGSKCYEVFAKRATPCPGCLMQQTLDSDQPNRFELDGVCHGKFHEVSSQPIHNKEGKIDGVLQIYRDRTLAKQLEKQLLQSEKLASIGLLAGGIAHEINNPLGGILVFSQMLLKEIDPKDPHFEDVKEIESATQRCKSIVENLLDFARQQPEIHEDKLVSVDLLPCLKSAIKFASVADGAKDIEIAEEYHVDHLFVMGNRNKAIQIFLNLIQNAFHAMPDGGTLITRAKVTNGYAIIEIEDTGFGIPADEIDRIFDPFYTSKEEGKGTGLGLSICHGIAEDMKGKIEVESEVDCGSCFRVILPITANKSRTA